MPDTTLLPEGVTTYTLDGDNPHTTYKLGDTVLLGAQNSVSRPGLIVAAIPGSSGLAGCCAVVRVTLNELPNLLAVLADLHRTAVTA